MRLFGLPPRFKRSYNKGDSEYYQNCFRSILIALGVKPQKGKILPTSRHEVRALAIYIATIPGILKSKYRSTGAYKSENSDCIQYRP